MASNVYDYDGFLEWCHQQGDELAGKAVTIAANDDGSNRTGHLMRGFFAALQFVREYPDIVERIRQIPRGEKRPIDMGDATLLDEWRDFLRKNSGRHAILRHVLPTNLGGVTTGGGGGGYPFKVALRLAADYVDQHAELVDGGRVERKYRMVRRRTFDRDTSLARDVKELYRYQCQVCGWTIELGNGRRYCESHHLRPLGGDHGGSDERDNIVVLCPSHHAEFDLFMFAIVEYRGRQRNLEHVSRRLKGVERTIRVLHTISRQSIDYVMQQFLTRRDLYYQP